MASAWQIAFAAQGPRRLLLRVAAALSLTFLAASARAQLEPLPLPEIVPAAERSFLSPDGWLIPESQQNGNSDQQGVIPAQYQLGLATFQPNPLSPQPGTAQFLDAPVAPAVVAPAEDDWDWRLLPTSVIYPSYWAAPKEPRFGGTHFFNGKGELIEEGVLGARFGLLRYGTPSDTVPQGWEWDVEGAAFPRLLPYDEFSMQACDYRIGTDFSYGVGPWRFRFGYYHLSSHVGDEYMIAHPEFVRVRYKRETLIGGVSNYPADWARLFFECGCAFDVAGEAKPLEFIFGTDLGTTEPTGLGGAPFAALAVHLRQEVDFGGNFTAQTGWMWRDKPFGHVFRVGFQFLTGYNPEDEFYRVYEQQYGLGLWYDF